LYYQSRRLIVQGEENSLLVCGESQIKIHKFLFKRDSPFFRTLFSLPQPPEDAHQSLELSIRFGEGESDDNPLIFQDSAEDFQSLCWVLYARLVLRFD